MKQLITLICMIIIVCSAPIIGAIAGFIDMFVNVCSVLKYPKKAFNNLHRRIWK